MGSVVWLAKVSTTRRGVTTSIGATEQDVGHVVVPTLEGFEGNAAPAIGRL